MEPLQQSPGVDLAFLGYVAVFAVSAIACLLSLNRARRVDDPDTRRGLAALLLTSTGWAIAHGGTLLAPNKTLKVAFYLVGLAVGFAAVGAWLYFCSAYTGRSLHRNQTVRRVAVISYLAIVVVKLTNPIHGLYFSTTLASTPFHHLAVDHHVLHWLAMGLAYVLSAVGYFMLFELFAQTGHDTRPLVVVVALTGLPGAFSIAGEYTDILLPLTYEPVGVAAFAVGIAFVYFERFQAIQLAGDIDKPVVFLGEDNDIRDNNDRARNLFPDLQGAIGEPFAAALPSVADHLDESGDEPLEIHRDGETRYYVVTTNPFTFGNTRVGRILLFTDVTRAEKHRREIEQKNERLGQFAGVISHDLRNPLAVAKGRIELARERRDDEDLQAAAEALDRMERLIEAVLALARRGDDVGELQTVSLSSAAESAWETVETSSADLEVESELQFRADPERLRQLLENLFRNAVEHGTRNLQQRDAAITVTVGDLPDADGAGFFVADDGPGIPPDERETIFGVGETSVEGGSGLGLAIVETIAGAHDWDVQAARSDDGGARFEISGVEEKH